MGHTFQISTCEEKKKQSFKPCSIFLWFINTHHFVKWQQVGGVDGLKQQETDEQEVPLGGTDSENMFSFRSSASPISSLSGCHNPPPTHTHTHAITCWMNFLTFADMFTVICNMKRSAKGADPLLKRTSSLSRITKVSKRRGAGSRCVRQTCIDLNRPFLPSVFACSERVHQGRPTTVNPSLCLRHH